MKISKSVTKFALKSQYIDLVSEKVQTFLETVGMERRNILRLRLSIEDILIKWQSKFGEEAVFSFIIGSQFTKPYIHLELKGEKYDPLEEDDEFSDYSSSMLSHMGLCPLFNYQKGTNVVSIQLKRRQVNPLTGLLFAFIGAIIFGFVGLLLPEELRTSCNNYILSPIYNTFFGIVSAIASPMIFLSVAWGIYGIGDTGILNRIGKKMFLRFGGITFLVTALSLAALMPFLHLNYANTQITTSGFKSIFELLLSVFPKDIFSPFIEGNTMQINLLAVAVGCVMLMLGNQTKMAAMFIEQVNYIVQYLMELVSNLVPLSIFIILLRAIWSDSVANILLVWKPLICYVVPALLFTIGIIIYVCLKLKVNIHIFMKKVLPTFLIAFTTASSSAAFGSNASCCEHSLGINPKMTSFGLPLGIVLYKPISAINFVACALCFSEMYNVEISIVWIITALIVITIVTMAVPPIVGGALACYIIAFTQLGIPAEALAIVIILDAVTDFISTGLDTVLIQCELLLQANKIEMVKKGVLYSANR